jgi:uroporphyrinogen decarboxylase
VEPRPSSGSWPAGISDSPTTNPSRLKRDFGGRIVLNGCIDTHHVLIKGTLELVRRRTREVLEVMKPGGGYVASPSHDCLLPETPVENVVAMYQAIREYGGY